MSPLYNLLTWLCTAVLQTFAELVCCLQVAQEGQGGASGGAEVSELGEGLGPESTCNGCVEQWLGSRAHDQQHEEQQQRRHAYVGWMTLAMKNTHGRTDALCLPFSPHIAGVFARGND